MRTLVILLSWAGWIWLAVVTPLLLWRLHVVRKREGGRGFDVTPKETSHGR